MTAPPRQRTTMTAHSTTCLHDVNEDDERGKRKRGGAGETKCDWEEGQQWWRPWLSRTECDGEEGQLHVGSCMRVNGIPMMEEEERGQRSPGVCSCASMAPSNNSRINGNPTMEEEERGEKPSGICSCASMAPSSCSCGHGIHIMKEEERGQRSPGSTSMAASRLKKKKQAACPHSWQVHGIMIEEGGKGPLAVAPLAMASARWKKKGAECPHDGRSRGQRIRTVGTRHHH